MTQLLMSLSGVRLCCFHGAKRRTTQKLLIFQGNSYSYTEPVLLQTAVIGIHANSC